MANIDILKERDKRQEGLVEHLQKTMEPEKGKIPAFIMGDAGVYQMEREKIFLKTWLFLGHESEVQNDGDFITRDLAGFSVIITRSKNGSLQAFYNKCTHRGMKLCRADRGNQQRFQCPYHGFTFKNDGTCIGVPLQKDIYGGELDKSDLSLHKVKIDTYKGMIFGTWNDEAEPLENFLGDYKWYLDIALGRTKMKVVGPPQKYVVNANWKVGADNFVGDSYHTMVTHGSIAKLGMVPSSKYSKIGYQAHTNNGHGCLIGMPNPDFAFPVELKEEYKANLTESQYEVLANLKNFIGNLFPNMSILVSHTEIKGKLISNTSIRMWKPLANNKMEVISWFLVEENASEDWIERSREAFILTFSPSGIFEQDDTEVFTDITEIAEGEVSLQKNYINNYTMGLHREPVDDFVGPGVVYDDKFTEASQRNFFRYWLDLIESNF